jgi:hypothetical protein
MDFELGDQHRMLKDLVRKLVDDQLTPLEAGVLALHLTAAEKKRIGTVSRELGLWGLDAPEDIGGDDLPTAAMVGVNEAPGRTITPYTLRPDSPNLRMLMATVTDRQRSVYLEPYVRGETVSAIAAGADLTAPGGLAIGDVSQINPLYVQAVRLYSNKKPIVAAVQGAAVGAGLGLALVADLRVAAPKARFTANFVKLGFHPGFSIAHALPRLIGEQQAALMCLIGRRIKAEEALAWGLVDQVEPLEGLRAAAVPQRSPRTPPWPFSRPAPPCARASPQRSRRRLTRSSPSRNGCARPPTSPKGWGGGRAPSPGPRPKARLPLAG